MNRFKKIYQAAVILVGILALVCLIRSFWEIRTLGSAVQKEARELLSELTDDTEGQNGDFLSEILLEDIGDLAEELGRQTDIPVGKALLLCRMGLVFSMLLAVVAAILSLILKKRIKYLAAFGAAGLGTLVLALMELVIVPWQIAGYLNGTGLLKLLSKEVRSAEVRRIMTEAMGAGFWTGLGLMLLLTLLCIAGYLLFRDEENRNTEIKAPVIRGMAGIYKDGTIPLDAGAEIIMGSDSARCNLVLSGKGISGKHCSVLFDEETDRYVITDFSRQGTYINENIPLEKGKPVSVKRGSTLTPGSEENQFLLE